MGKSLTDNTGGGNTFEMSESVLPKKGSVA